MAIFTKKKNIDAEKCCAYCEYAEFTEDEEFMLCAKKGKVEAFHSCRRFSYDLLKRKPRVMMEIPTIDPEALEL